MSDEYPNDEQLENIRTWEVHSNIGVRALLDYVKSLWHWPDWGWSEYEGRDDFDRHVTYAYISTGGSSGNEDLIEALHDNTIFWMLCWLDHRRGGHYRFWLNPLE